MTGTLFILRLKSAKTSVSAKRLTIWRGQPSRQNSSVRSTTAPNWAETGVSKCDISRFLDIHPHKECQQKQKKETTSLSQNELRAAEIAYNLCPPAATELPKNVDRRNRKQKSFSSAFRTVRVKKQTKRESRLKFWMFLVGRWMAKESRSEWHRKWNTSRWNNI